MKIALAQFVRVLTVGLVAYGTLTSAGAAADGPGVPVLVVSGSGTASRAPDTVSIALGAQAIEPTVEAAQGKVNKVMTDAAAAIQAVGVARSSIRTSGLLVQTVYERRKEPARLDEPEAPPRVLGYRAELTLTVRLVDVTLAGKVIDAAIKAGATELHGLVFGLVDDTPEQSTALAKAVARAKAKGEAIASALGVEIIGVLEVTDDGWQQGGGRSPFSEAYETSVEPGEVVVKAEVQIQFQIAPVRK